MSNKTIDINPDLFKIRGNNSKTRRKKETSSSSSESPSTHAIPAIPKNVISPNVLKNKLLKRIKDHRKKEARQKPTALDISATKSSEKGGGGGNSDDDTDDEFRESLVYLQTIAETQAKSAQAEKHKKELERKTLKHYHSLATDAVNTVESLQAYEIDTHPYGCLKNGIKPTYKVWNKTRRSGGSSSGSGSSSSGGSGSSSSSGSANNSNTIDAEKRLDALKSKILDKQNASIMSIATSPYSSVSVPSKSNVFVVQPQPQPQPQQKQDQTQEQKQETQPPKPLLQKRYLRKTIRTKHILGKAPNAKHVGVLIKDRMTRKQVLLAQKELTHKPIGDVRIYLKEHNLIKDGSNAPTAIIRKMYESSILAGEITNNNSAIMMHNLMASEG